MTETDVREILQAQVDADKTQAKTAARFGISRPYLNDVLAGRRKPGKRLLDAMGLVRVEEYYLKEEQS